MPPEGIVVITLAIVLVSGVLLLPLVRSLAERIRGRADGPVREELQTLRDDVMQELQHVRHEVGELSERVDFTERLLAKQRESQRLGRGDQ
jgi:hypothetical protein